MEQFLLFIANHGLDNLDHAMATNDGRQRERDVRNAKLAVSARYAELQHAATIDEMEMTSANTSSAAPSGLTANDKTSKSVVHRLLPAWR